MTSIRKKGRVLSIAPSWPKGGMGRMSVEYRESFLARGIPADFSVLFDRSPRKSWLGLRTGSGDREFSSLDELLEAIGTREREVPYRIVHLHSPLNENTQGEIIPKLREVMPEAAFVFTFHDIYTKGNIPESERQRLEHLLASVDDLIYISEYTRRKNENGYPNLRGKGHVILNGTNFFRYENDAEVLRLAQELRSRYAPNGEKVLLWFGRPVEKKGYKDLVKAFELVHKRNPNVVLVLGVDEKNRPEIDELAPSASQNVRLVGWQYEENTAAHYKAADLLVFPSHNEAFGLIPIEAIATGTPAAISDCAWSQATYIEPGIAYGFEPRNPQSIADVVSQALADDVGRKALAEKAYAYASEHYTWGRVVEQTLDVYDKALASKCSKSADQGSARHKAGETYDTAMDIVRNGSGSRAENKRAEELLKSIEAQLDVSTEIGLIYALEQAKNIAHSARNAAPGEKPRLYGEAMSKLRDTLSIEPKFRGAQLYLDRFRKEADSEGDVNGA